MGVGNTGVRRERVGDTCEGGRTRCAAVAALARCSPSAFPHSPPPPPSLLPPPSVDRRAHLDADERRQLAHLGVRAGHLVHRVGDELQHQVQVHLVAALPLVAVLVEVVLQRDDVGVSQRLHDLQLPVLEPLVLQYLLDRHRLARLHDARLKHHAEAAVANHAVGHQLQRVRLAGWGGGRRSTRREGWGVCRV